MPTDPDQETAAPKPTGTMTFSELIDHYFAMGNGLYEAKVKGNAKDADLLQRMADAILDDLTTFADEKGIGKQFRSMVWNERGSAKRTLWIRMTANRLKATKPALLSLELLGSAGVVMAVAYFIFHTDASIALFSGLGIVALRIVLPWVMDKAATHEERALRKLRRIENDPNTG
jgi:hypothetical protein